MKYQVELVWNRSFHFVPYGGYLQTLDSAIEVANELEESGDGARVKKTRVVDENGKTVYEYGTKL